MEDSQNTVVNFQYYGDYYGGYGNAHEREQQSKSFVQKSTELLFGLVPISLNAYCYYSVDQTFSAPTTEWSSVKEFTAMSTVSDVVAYSFVFFDIKFGNLFYLLGIIFHADSLYRVYNAEKSASSTLMSSLCALGHASSIIQDFFQMGMQHLDNNRGVPVFEQKGDGNYY